ncbi:hypothetical protein [Tenacibaculum sp. M341]|uniref:hypothetical protein n=1 Tax=Tenacibaculum sp. M341 TaxID=2530339 RepID=UPI0010498052|nr:hypothetical protein [Tenacibaculum sp. M341]TCI85542.1 hypothetical protein EYW44_16410 [Tenacibaculum sp. M341]
MRTYPKDIKKLEEKHSFNFPINQQKLERIQSDVILRHDITFLFLKSRILNTLREKEEFKNRVTHESFLDKKIGSTDRLKIYNAIKNKVHLSVHKKGSRSSLYPYLILVAFLIPWICYLIFFSKEEITALFSFANPKLFALLFFIGVSIVTIFDYKFGYLFKNPTPYIDTRVKTIREFICSLIRQNRNDIKSKFEIIFNNDLEKVNQ